MPAAHPIEFVLIGTCSSTGGAASAGNTSVETAADVACTGVYGRGGLFGIDNASYTTETALIDS